MSRLFISHSSENNPEAVAIRDWLAREGWDEVFLDLEGIAAGERWERALNEAASRCEAVVFLISRAWLDSRWCLKEFNLARRLNKRLFGVLIEAIPLADLPEDLSGTWQVVDLAAGQDHEVFRVTLPVTHAEVHVTLSREGLARLRGGLARAGLEPRFFNWPPKDDAERPPYRGLKPLEAEDAGIFFGRDAPIVEALDQLRGLRDAASPRLLMIIGASGSGKSSFLRAGLMPRLARDDRNFLPLPTIRPEHAALTGDAGLVPALEAALTTYGLTHRRVDIRNAVAGGAETVRPLLQQIADKAFARTLAEEGAAPHPTIVIAIDQAEELFSAGGLGEGDALLTLLRDLASEDRPGIIVLFTIRSDSYDRLETAKPLEGLRQQTLPLLPMPRGAYQTVIEGPAARLATTTHRLRIEPGLTQRLLEDIEKGGGSDSLPLLAFTLEQLYRDYGGLGVLTAADYEAFGGIGGAIEAAVGRVLKAADADPRIPREREAQLLLLRRGLIPWLAGVDPETGSPRRRIARLADVPPEAAPLIALLVEQRLLSTDAVTTEDGARETTVEPAHEALLRQWGLLQGWLEEDLGALTTLEAVKRAARDWAANNRAPDWLNHAGGRLEDAEQIAARPDFTADLSADARDYLRHCRDAEAAQRREREQAQARTLKLQRRVLSVVMAGLVAALILAGLAGWQWRTAQTQQVLAEAHLGEARLSQSQFLTPRALEALAAGQPELAGLIARAALPADMNKPDRQLWSPAVSALTLARDADFQRAIMAGHTAEVLSAAWSPDGTRIVTASDDKTARVWDAKTGAQLALLQGHTGTVFSAAWNPDGTRIITASSDHTARVWDAKTGAKLALLQGHTDKVRCAAWSPDGTRIVTASDDETARVWDAKTGAQLALLQGHTGAVFSAAWSPDGTRIVTATDDDRARVWDATTGAQLALFWGRTIAAWSPDGTRIVTATDDDTARVWDAKTGAQLALLPGVTNDAEWSPDGTRIVIASGDDTAQVWDAKTGAQLALLQGKRHYEKVWSAAWSRGGRRIVTASDDDTARVFDAKTGAQLALLQGHTGAVLSAAWSPDGTRIVTASDDKTARVWDAKIGAQLALLQGHTAEVLSAAWSPDGTRIVTASDDTTARVWDAKTGAQLALLQGHTAEVLSAAWSPDGTRIVTASDDTTARVWDAKTGAQLALLQGHTGGVLSAAWSPDGTRIVTASGHETARVWDAKTGAQLALLQGHTDGVSSAAWSPDGTRIVTASDDKTARVWDAKTGAQLALLQGHTDKVRSAAWSPDGTRIVTASYDKTARVWDAKTGAQLALLQGSTAEVLSAAWSPDGARIVAASDDKTARMWDAKTGAQLALLQGHTGGVLSAAWSPDGTCIVTASYDKTARMWDAKTGAQLALLQGHNGGVLSAAWSPDGTRIVTASYDKTARVWDAWPLLTADTVVYADITALRALTAVEREALFLGAAKDAEPAPTVPTQDVAKMSVEQLRAAVDAGNPYANRRLAELYELGDGVPKDIEKALFHHTVEVRLFEAAGDELDAIAARTRRGSDARTLSPEAAVRVAHEAMIWKQSR